jgi:hypothetical protein
MIRTTRLLVSRLEPRDVPSTLPFGIHDVTATYNLDQLLPNANRIDDVNGDGVTDYRIPAPTGDAGFIVSGSDGTLISRFGTPQPSVIQQHGLARSRSLAADVDGDGTDDVVVLNDGATLDVFSGATGAAFVTNHRPYEDLGTGLLYAAAGDFDGDGRDELVVAPDGGGSARVIVLKAGGDSASLSFSPVANFFAIDDPNYRGGASVAVGDFDGDGTPDLAVGAVSGGPRVAFFDGRDLAAGSLAPKKLRDDFFALGATSTFQRFLGAIYAPGTPLAVVLAQNILGGDDVPAVGVNLTAGDFDGDGRDDLAVGAGMGGGPQVRVFGGKSLLDPIAIEVLADFFVTGQTALRTGARVQTDPVDQDGDGKADLLVRIGGFPGEPTTGVEYLGADLHLPAGLEPTGKLGGLSTSYRAGDEFVFTESW